MVSAQFSYLRRPWLAQAKSAAQASYSEQSELLLAEQGMDFAACARDLVGKNFQRAQRVQ